MGSALPPPVWRAFENSIDLDLYSEKET